MDLREPLRYVVRAGWKTGQNRVSSVKRWYYGRLLYNSSRERVRVRLELSTVVFRYLCIAWQ